MSFKLGAPEPISTSISFARSRFSWSVRRQFTMSTSRVRSGWSRKFARKYSLQGRRAWTCTTACTMGKWLIPTMAWRTIKVSEPTPHVNMQRASFVSNMGWFGWPPVCSLTRSGRFVHWRCLPGLFIDDVAAATVPETMHANSFIKSGDRADSGEKRVHWMFNQISCNLKLKNK